MNSFKSESHLQGLGEGNHWNKLSQSEIKIVIHNK